MSVNQSKLPPALRNRKLPAIKGLTNSRLGDAYHLLLRAPWWQVISLVALGFITLNVLFATAFYFVGGVKGAHPDSLADAFFFSVQTMGTIGYGAMYPESAGANTLVTVEAILGLICTAVVTGLAFAKFARPNARVMFSRYAVVSLRDRMPTLMVRVANERSTHIVEATMRLSMLRWETTAEGERIRRIYDLPLARSQSPAFLMTWTALHVIDERSPFYGLTADLLKQRDIQLIVSLQGHDQTFAATVHAQYFYGSDEVIWNKRFADVMLEDAAGERIVDYTRFHDLVDAPVPLPAVTS